MKSSTVSVVLPTYNESGHIVDLVKEVIASIPAGWGYEILVVVREALNRRKPAEAPAPDEKPAPVIDLTDESAPAPVDD